MLEKTSAIKIKCFIILFMLSVFWMQGSMVYGQDSLTRGHQVLLQHGMQFNAVTLANHFKDENGDQINIDMDLWTSANFTTADIHQDYHTPSWNRYDHMTAYGMPTGANAVPFKVWVADSDGGVCSEQYLSKLRAVQFGDEQSILNPSVLPGMASEVAILKSKYPNAIITMNQDPGASGYSATNGITLDVLKTYTQTVQPDMLYFTEYPFRWQDTSYPVQDYEGGSPKNLYVHMEMYRKAGLAGLDGTGSQPIPVGMYLETFSQPSNGAVNDRQPTESEYRLQQFAGLAFGMKSFDAFVYNYAAPDELDSIFFEGATQTPTAEFNKIAEMNRQARNIAPALVRLISTDVRMEMGQREDGSTNPLPEGVTVWDLSADNYLKSVSAINLGTKNDGKAGDVIVGFFNPLDDSLVEQGAENDVYFMVVNGLSDEAGSAADCMQTIHMEFDFADSGINQLLRLNRETGQVEVVQLTLSGDGSYFLDINLEGGTGDLFKFDTGTVFIPEPATLSILIAGFILVRRNTTKYRI